MEIKYQFAAQHYLALLLFALVCQGYGRAASARTPLATLSDAVLRGTLELALGTGVVICLLQIAGAVGALLPVVICGIGIVGLVLALWQLRIPSAQSWKWPHWGSWIVLLVATSTMVYPLRIPLAWDELAYHLPHAREWAEQGRLQINASIRYAWFPYNYDLLYAAALSVYDDVMPHLLHGYAGWLTAVLVHRWTMSIAGRAAACAASVFWLLLAQAEFATAYVDMGLALFVCAAFVVLHLWREAIAERRLLYMASFLLGVAIGSKYQGLTFLPLFAGVVVLADRRRGTWLRSAAFVAIACVYWYARNALMTGDPFHPLGGRIFGFTEWNAGDYAAQLSDIKANFGWPPACLLLAAAAPLLAWRNHRAGRIWATAAFSAYAMLVWVFTSHYPRYLLPAYPALCVLTGAVLWASVSTAWARIERERFAFFHRGYGWRAVQLVVLVAVLVVAQRRYHFKGDYEWSLVSPTVAERHAALKDNLPRYGGVLAYLREHPARRIYQMNLEAVLYYLPRPVMGDHFGPWRYRDYAQLAPQPLAERLQREGFDTLVVSLHENSLSTSPDLSRYFDRVYADSDMHVYKIRSHVR
ncbi:hypothetical protein DFQ15_12052 [Xylophilus ampelinus]|uniref:Dolichyl-phosphate-mannose-protein mannosyltransferase n=1 Tax=Xylophilus ampelinus TaxID=54067 RepID=A0A318SF02_9BURK|nr:hypothetical protein DFQ15_12052 [Xylophilus ampelinus]